MVGEAFVQEDARHDEGSILFNLFVSISLIYKYLYNLLAYIILFFFTKS